jgi:hypothetical protein
VLRVLRHTSDLSPTSPRFIVVAMEEPQHRFCDQKPIVQPGCPLSRFFGIVLFHSAALDPHLELSFDHVLVKLHVALCGEQPVGNIDSLHTSMTRFEKTKSAW